MNFKLLTLLVMINFSLASHLLGQHERVHDAIVFSTKIDNPISIETLQHDNKYDFYAKNRSFYPYRLRFEFNEFLNLTPFISKRDYILQPGRNKLFSVSVKDEKNPHTYSYKISFMIGLLCDEIDEKFPYLIPIKILDARKILYSPDQTIHANHFQLQKGDTIFCMRKGLVVAVPNMFNDADRISQTESLEIMHKDNSVLKYENIDPENTFVKAGQKVYPGQPIGLIGENSILEVQLLAFQKDNFINSIKIFYATDNLSLKEFPTDFENLIVNYPKEIVTKEMTKREIKKYNKNSL